MPSDSFFFKRLGNESIVCGLDLVLLDGAMLGDDALQRAAELYPPLVA
jgi:hypothetical protein